MRYKSEETIEKIKKSVEEFFFLHRRSPSITEIAKSVGCARSTVHSYLHEMNKSGVISYNGKEKVIETKLTRKANADTIFTPIVCTVACGTPQLEEENFEAYLPLPTSLRGTGEFFLLRANGESMIEAGIDPGDLVVVRKQNTANEGDIIVALINNETTLKRFYIDNERKCIRLHPENRKMSDIYVSHCYIQGVTQKLIKNL